jgi:hypothetical protein
MMRASAIAALLVVLAACSPTAHVPTAPPHEYRLFIDKRGQQLAPLQPHDTLMVEVTVPQNHFTGDYWFKKCYRRNDSIIVDQYRLVPAKQLLASPVASFPVYWVANTSRLVATTAVTQRAFRSAVDSVEQQMRRFKAFTRRLEFDRYFLYKNDSTWLSVNDPDGGFKKANNSWLIQ